MARSLRKVVSLSGQFHANIYIGGINYEKIWMSALRSRMDNGILEMDFDGAISLFFIQRNARLSQDQMSQLQKEKLVEK